MVYGFESFDYIEQAEWRKRMRWYSRWAENLRKYLDVING